MTSTTSKSAPQVWIGCLHCYNSGRLVGVWVDADSAEDLSLADVHRETGRIWLGCEEVWCLDTDGIPNPHEMGVSTAAAWGELFERVGAEQWPALCAWVDSGCHVTDGDNIPDASTFEERYRGRWDSWTEYADMVAEETDLMDKWPEEAKRYFNWAAWRRDLAHDYTVVDADAPDYGVFVFSNN